MRLQCQILLKSPPPELTGLIRPGSSAVRATPLVVTMSYNVDHEFDLRCLDMVFHFAIGR